MSGDRDRTHFEEAPSRANERSTIVGLVLAILTIAIVALWTQGAVNAAENRFSEEARLIAAYSNIQIAEISERDAIADFAREPNAIVRAQLTSASLRFEEALRSLNGVDTGLDREAAQTLGDLHALSASSMRELFTAVDVGIPQDVDVFVGDIDDAHDRITAILDERNQEAIAGFSGALARLQQARRLGLLATIAALVVGITLVGLVIVRLRMYRERADAAVSARIAHLEDVARTDSLTSLSNHRAFHEDLAKAVRAGDGESTLWLALLDLDGLKETNERYGHTAGDARLLALADAMRTFASVDLPGSKGYRVGGDEFAMILRGLDEQEAAAVAQTVQAHIRRGGLAEGNSVAVGVAPWVDGMQREVLIRRADRALIAAKPTPGDTVVWSPELELAMPVAADRVRAVAEALARAVDAKDSYTRSHCQMVSDVAARIAIELGLAAEHVERVRLAGLLHDVGKIGVADSILHKPGALTRDEMDIMELHSTLGERIVQGAGLDEIARWIRHHHERIDGAGYPDGLSGAQIPIESRIVLVADAFEAMTADRPYRSGQSIEWALEELRANAGAQFDEDCVAAAERLLAGSDAPRRATDRDRQARSSFGALAPH